VIVELWQRDFSAPMIVPSGLLLQPVRYSHQAIGGPRYAEIAVSGSAVMDVANWLRCPVWIKDDYQRPLWWGYIEEVNITQGKRSFGWTLEGMANKVKVVYEQRDSRQTTTGRKAETGWLSNAASQSRYGLKHGIFSLNAATADKAKARRRTALNQLAWPLFTLGDGGQDGAALYCRGWWDILGWSPWSAARYNETSVPSGGRMPAYWHSFGKAETSRRVIAQKVVLPATKTDFWADILDMQLGVGDPSKSGGADITVELQTDSAGTPSGTVLASGSLARTSIVHWGWHKIELSPKVALSTGTTYWIVFRRTAGWNTYDNGSWVEVPYVVNTYPSGGTKQRWSDGSWTALTGSTGNLLFGLWGMSQTTTQVKSIITSVKQNLLTGCSVVNQSGIPAPMFHDTLEALNARDEVERLLAVGATSGRRMLASVTAERLVRVYAEPPSSSVTLAIYPDGTLAEYAGGSQPVPLPAEFCPVARWARLVDLVPNTADTTALGTAGPVFIESAEYDVASRTWTPETRDVASPWDLERSL
jgi:hypothetical protein